jgi:hypothetical protein
MQYLFLPFTLTQKVMVVSGLVAIGEDYCWIGAANAGKWVVEKYRKYLSPRVWFS